MEKFYSFAKNASINAKFTGNIVVFIEKSMLKFQKDNTSVGKVMAAFPKHTKFSNSQTMLFDRGVRNKNNQN